MRKLLLVLLFVIGTNCFGQSLTVFNIDTMSYPILKASFYAFDVTGNKLSNFTTSDFDIKEYGKLRKVTNVTCPAPIPPAPISSVLILDVSGSMQGKGLSIAKAGARAWINMLDLGSSDCAVTSFDNKSYFNQDFTTNKTKLLSVIDLVYTNNGGTNYNSALLYADAGGVLVASKGKHKRVVVFLTDGMPDSIPKISEILDMAKLNNVTIYCLTIGLQAPVYMKDLANQTGGFCFENITNEYQAADCYRRILKIAQGDNPCKLEWEAETNCLEDLQNGYWIDVEANLKTINAQATAGYNISGNLITKLSISPSVINFRNIMPGNKADSIIKFTAINQDFNVQRITSTNPAFSISPQFFSLKKNESINLTVRFTPQDSGYTFTKFSIESDICPAFFYSTGGFPGKKPKLSTLKLIKPNGGEYYIAGSDSIIEWEGVSDFDKVRLEYSIDNGFTWKLLDGNANSLKYIWKNIPKPVSDQCIIKVKQISDSASDSGGELFTLIGHTNSVNKLSPSPDGTKLATASADKTVMIWDPATSVKLQELIGHDAPISALAWSPDGTKIATASEDNSARIWDVATGAELKKLNEHAFWVSDVAWSPDGKQILTAGVDFQAIIWDAATGNINKKLKGHTFPLNTATWSNKGDRIVTTSHDSTAIIWDAATGKILYKLKGHDDVVYVASWSPDDQRIATGAYNGSAIIWDATLGKLENRLTGHSTVISSISWNPPGDKILTSSFDNTAIIWDANSGTVLKILAGHKYAVNYAAWNSDGTRVATASSDNTAKIWNTQTGEKLQTLVGHTGEVKDVKWGKNDAFIATSSADKTAKIWQIGSPDSLLQEDESDKLFSIVAPETFAFDVDMGEALINSLKDSLLTIFTANKGSYKYKVDSIYISGPDASAFAIVSGFPKYELNPGNTHFIEFKFSPTKLGSHNATIAIITNSDTLFKSITGIGVTPRLQTLVDVIDFGQVHIGDEKTYTDTLVIKNVSTTDINITNTLKMSPDIEQFDILSGDGAFTLAPGSSKAITLRFKPKYGGRTSGRIGFEYNDPGSPAIVNLYGVGIGGLIAIPNDSAYAGETRNITLRLENVKPEGIKAIAKSFSAKLKFQGRIIAPEDFSLVKSFVNDTIIIQVTGDLQNDTTLISIPVRAALGNAEVTAIEVSDFTLFDYSGIPLDYSVDVQYGRFKLLGICREGGTRLINPTSQAQILSVLPNPANNLINIEYRLNEIGFTEILLINELGETVKSINFESTSDFDIKSATLKLDDISNGKYILVLKTPTFVERKSVMIIK